jgi:hypothetical protein
MRGGASFWDRDRVEGSRLVSYEPARDAVPVETGTISATFVDVSGRLSSHPTRRQPGMITDHEHLAASAGVDGIEAFYQRCVANGVRSSSRSLPLHWGTKDFCAESGR